MYLNITNRCSCACEFCLRAWTDGVYGEYLVLGREPELDELTQAIELEFLEGPADEVVFCGFGEPTMRLDVVLAVAEWLHLRRVRYDNPARNKIVPLPKIERADLRFAQFGGRTRQRVHH